MKSFYELNYGKETANLIGKNFKYIRTNSRFSILSFGGGSTDFPLLVRYKGKVSGFCDKAIKEMITKNELVEIKN
tara:strand:- start:678 stop:902 length:225 start_codon:yes stop_codon:yes gene_type:complete